MIALWLALALLAGLAIGFVTASRQVARMIARMSPDQVDALGDRVWELNHGAE